MSQHLLDAPQPRLAGWLLWTGPLALLAGLLSTPVLGSLHGGRALSLLGLALAALALAFPIARLLRWRLASGLLLVWAAAHAFFAGPPAALAAMLLAASALALGSVLVPAAAPARGALALLCGLALLAAAVGWLLPFPLHRRGLYLVVLVLPILWRRRALLALAGQARAQWSGLLAAEPALAAVTVIALGLASTGTWLPTLQYDDLAYHLGLPAQLQTLGYYRMDPATQVWALAPWGSDVLHGIAQVLAGGEARGSVNLLWLGAGAAAIWALCQRLAGCAACGWLGMALYASLPLTATLAGGMQTEGPGAALVLALALAIQTAPAQADGGWLRLFAVLAGALLGLKISFALALVPLGLWLLWRWRGRWPWRALPAALLLGFLVGGSSYAYAWSLAGNPVLPLFNGVFGSPYFAAVNFHDGNYPTGLTPAALWGLVFDSHRYYEGWAGSAGFSLIGLAGGGLLALARPSSRALALAGLGVLLGPLAFMLYLRYAHPGQALLLAPMLAGVAGAGWRRSLIALSLTLVALNFAFQANGYWTLRTGALNTLILQAGADEPLFKGYAPERMLIRQLQQTAPDARVLFGGRPYSAEMAGRGFTLHWYDHALEQARDQQLITAASPAALRALIAEYGFTHVLIGGEPLWPALPAQLSELGAVLEGEFGNARLWRLPPAPPPPTDPVRERDLARRLWPR